MSPAFGIVVAVVYLIHLGLFGDWILALTDGNDWVLITVLILLGVPSMWISLKLDNGMRKLMKKIFEGDL